MKCILKNCEKRKYCEKAHKSQDIILGKDDTILIPNEFFSELNMGNRLAKRGIPEDGYEFGCFELVESPLGSGQGILSINEKIIASFKFRELMNYCNDSFNNLIENEAIKIYLE